jgi:hypothetical protein
MALDSVAKVTVSIGPATACKTAAEFQAIASGSWKAIAHVQDVGEIKADKPTAVGKYLDQDYVRKLAGGPRDMGDLEMVFGYDDADEGQIALKAADLDNNAYCIKIELPDAPEGATSTPTTWFMMAIVNSTGVKFGDGSDPISLNATFAIDGGIVEVPATAGV